MIIMIFISATRLRVKSFIYLPAFFIANERSTKQLLQTPGFLWGKELIDIKFTFWTLTFWNDIIAMKTFRNSPPHQKAMQKLPYWCDEATYVHWTDEDDAEVSWQTVHAKMTGEGRVTKVRQPSANHLTKIFPAPKWTKTERVFKQATAI